MVSKAKIPIPKMRHTRMGIPKGLYKIESYKFPRIASLIDLEVPHPGHSIPNKKFMGHLQGNTPYANRTMQHNPPKRIRANLL